MRAFLALDLADDVRGAIAAEARRLRANAPGARWLADAALHLTLVFLGEVPDERTPELTLAVGAAAAQHGPIAFEARGGGTFGGRRARVLWVGIDGAVAALRGLQRDLAEATLALGVGEREDRAYSPHLTLARARAPGGDPALAACAAALAGSSFGTTRAAEVVLYRSELGPGGARHTAIARLPLSAPGE